MTEQTIDAYGAAGRLSGARTLFMWGARGARTVVLKSPRWQGLVATPALVAGLTAAGIVLTVLLDRLFVMGPARFHWQAVASGWYAPAVTAWVCYLMRPQPAHEPGGTAAPSAAHLYCMMLAQSLVLSLALWLPFSLIVRYEILDPQSVPGAWTWWAFWPATLLWALAAQLTLLWRAGTRRIRPMSAATLSLLLVTALFYRVGSVDFWYPEQTGERAEYPRFALTQEVMESQQAVLRQRLDGIHAGRPGTVDVYSISFAPYADEDVFRRESALVSEVMVERFDAAGRTLQLVNNARTVGQWPWATPINLQRAIQRVAAAMDREEDVLFLHLTSHGAQDGELAANFWPISLDSVRPTDLKAWLDEAGIQYRVISISACFSGSWIPALADDNTLVVTAADAEHTSYGCGTRSDLTFFGRAMYDEQLRHNTLSFEAAHAAARKIIRQREEEAGKDDGYSNPQIHVGEGIRGQLAKLEARLARR